MTLSHQILGVASGLLVVRLLSKTEYAQYSLGLTILAGVVALSEAGSVSSLLSEGGKRIASGAASHGVFARVRWFRIRFWLLFATLSLPVAAFVFEEADAPSFLMLALVSMVILSSFFESSEALFKAQLALDQRIKTIASISLLSSAARLAIIGAICLSGFPRNMVLVSIIVSNIAGSLLSFILARRLVSLPPKIVFDESVSGALKENARRQLPNSAFFVVQSLVLPLLLLSYASLEQVGELSALSRFSLAFGVVSSVVVQLAVPRLALSSDPRRVRIIYLAACGGFLVIALGVMGLFWAANDFFLALLGGGYAGLAVELLLVSCGALVSNLVGVMTTLNQARAWLKLAWMHIPISVIWLALLLLVFRPDDLMSASVFAALAPLPGVASTALSAILGIRSSR